MTHLFWSTELRHLAKNIFGKSIGATKWEETFIFPTNNVVPRDTAWFWWTTDRVEVKGKSSQVTFNYRSRGALGLGSLLKSTAYAHTMKPKLTSLLTNIKIYSMLFVRISSHVSSSVTLSSVWIFLQHIAPLRRHISSSDHVTTCFFFSFSFSLELTLNFFLFLRFWEK